MNKFHDRKRYLKLKFNQEVVTRMSIMIVNDT